MSKFKVNDRVRETATGDEGIVCGDEDGNLKRPDAFPENIYVNWETGQQGEYHIGENEIMLCVDNSTMTVGEAIDILTKSGYTVTISKTF